MADDFLIYHIYADVGVESEPLSAYGQVVRVGLDPMDTNESEPVRADATKLPLAEGADLAVLHPPCQKFSKATHSQGDPNDHQNLIPDARRVARDVADHYIIENVPDAPLEDPVILDGRMFGLPIPYRRAFETSFQVDAPPVQVGVGGGNWEAHRDTGGWQGTVTQWRSVKQVTGDYPATELKRSGIPAPYIHYLCRHWLDAIIEGDDTDG